MSTEENGTAISVKELEKHYGELKAVNNIDLSIKKGEVFAFLGPNGAGKTTTVEMIVNIRTPTKGSISVLGLDPQKDMKHISERIGILPQEFKSFERLTVRETLKYYSALFKKNVDIDELLKHIDIEDQAEKLYKNLSGGLKQRVGVAIALVNDPEIVFLDEPTTGLDPKARRGVWKVIAGLKDRNKTVFLTTHYMEEAEYLADRIAIIDAGSIIAMGRTEELIDRYGGVAKLTVKGCGKNGAEAIKKVLALKEFDQKNGDITFQLQPEQEVLDVLHKLKENGIGYKAIDIRRSNLEDVFLSLTGKSLKEEEQ